MILKFAFKNKFNNIRKYMEVAYDYNFVLLFRNFLLKVT